MYIQRKWGIKFSSEGNPVPCVLSDASNKPDPNDGLCHHGFVATLQGGPIGWGSKKLPHVGLSAFHNEYIRIYGPQAAPCSIYIEVDAQSHG